MYVKQRVSLSHLHPLVWWAIQAVEIIHRVAFGESVTVTSAKRSGPGDSLHDYGLAFDIRTRHLQEFQKQLLRDLCAEILGPWWDVVLESDHLHMEVDFRALAAEPFSAWNPRPRYAGERLLLDPDHDDGGTL